MPAQDSDLDPRLAAALPTPAPERDTDQATPFHVDLPQYVEAETQPVRARPLRPLPDRELGRRGVRDRLVAAATSWRVKGTIQKVLGVVPGGAYLHHQLQRRIGGLRDFTRECDIKVSDWCCMMDHLRGAGVRIGHACFLEMGTGWYPTFPVCLYLGGAQHVLTLDLNRLLDPELTRKLIERLAIHLPQIAQLAHRDLDEVRTAHAALLAAVRRGATLDAATGGAITYRAPADAAATQLPPGSIDVVFSNSVLEHVPPEAIEACFREAMRILRPGGVVFHSVNCGDHYAYTDRSINPLHYLSYSDAAWRRWNNAFLYQNRLRAIDFTRMCTRAGFRIELDTSRPHPMRFAQLDALRVDPRFASYSREQLVITSIDFIGRKPGASSDN